MVSMQADGPGIIETGLLQSEGGKLFVNADVKNGELKVEVLDIKGDVIPGFHKNECISLTLDSVKQHIVWNKPELLPREKPFVLRFYLSKGNLYSFTIE
jgi:hypothetical protein